MAVATIMPGFGGPAFPTTRRPVPCDPTSHGDRAIRATYRRRRLAVVGVALGLVLVAAQAGVALGGSPLAAPERRPASAPVEAIAGTVAVVVEPGDSLWSIAERIAPGEDPRPAVDAVDRARGGAPLMPGETIMWPR